MNLLFTIVTVAILVGAGVGDFDGAGVGAFDGAPVGSGVVGGGVGDSEGSAVVGAPVGEHVPRPVHNLPRNRAGGKKASKALPRPTLIHPPLIMSCEGAGDTGYGLVHGRT